MKLIHLFLFFSATQITKTTTPVIKNLDNLTGRYFKLENKLPEAIGVPIHENGSKVDEVSLSFNPLGTVEIPRICGAEGSARFVLVIKEDENTGRPACHFVRNGKETFGFRNDAKVLSLQRERSSFENSEEEDDTNNSSKL